MRKDALRIILICGALALLFVLLNPPGSRVINSPFIQQISAMRQIGMKLREYDLDHPATETEDLKTKSIDDLVEMHVLTPADAAYLRDHQITFHGYDPNHIGGDIPLLEGIYTRGSTQKRIICYSDISVVTSPIERTK